MILLQKRGLGNQLFQYAAGLYFANAHGAKLDIVMEAPKEAWSAGRPRPCLLSNFSLSVPIRKYSIRDRLLSACAGMEHVRAILRVDHYRQPDCETWIFLPALPVSQRSRNVYIEGFFESYHFPDHVEQKLRKDLIFREDPKGLNIKSLAMIQRCSNPVSIHLRRGDYAVERAGENLLPVSYYRNAIDEVRQSVSAPTFFIFSDDIGFARKHLSSGDDMVFVDHNGEADAHEDLRLMSACSHHVIANSTFSWWGAWLNPNRQKLVFAPARWRKHSYPNVPEIIPPGWTRIPLDGYPCGASALEVPAKETYE